MKLIYGFLKKAKIGYGLLAILFAGILMASLFAFRVYAEPESGSETVSETDSETGSETGSEIESGSEEESGELPSMVVITPQDIEDLYPDLSDKDLSDEEFMLHVIQNMNNKLDSLNNPADGSSPVSNTYPMTVSPANGDLDFILNYRITVDVNEEDATLHMV